MAVLNKEISDIFKNRKRERIKELDAKRKREKYQRNPEPTGRNAILTADPILKQLFIIAWQKKISLKDLSIKINRSTVALTNWKKGAHTPSMIDVVILAEALGYNVVLQEKDNVNDQSN